MTRPFVVEAVLSPIVGHRFQPTGFPDLGAATFDYPGEDGPVKALLVESAQSMANRLEDTGWNRAEQQPVPVLEGLPYVRVVAEDDGRYLTSSRTEAHRLSSAFVRDSFLDGKNMVEIFKERFELRDNTPVSAQTVAIELFKLDPMCLLHGVFFADKKLPGQPKVPRAVTGMIEAHHVQSAMSGGVKRDDVAHSKGESRGASEGYGFVPFHRTEWTAREIVASFVIDDRQIDAYGLPDEAVELLKALARWEVRSVLDGGLRLRTACDLKVDEFKGDELSSLEELTERVAAAARACRSHWTDGVLEVRWPAKSAK